MSARRRRKTGQTIRINKTALGLIIDADATVPLPAGRSPGCSVLLTAGDRGVKISNVRGVKLEAADKQRGARRGEEKKKRKKKSPTVAASASSPCAGDDVNSTVNTLCDAGKFKRRLERNQIVVCFISNCGGMCPRMHLFTRAGSRRVNRMCTS